ncbi:MAG: hydantoinase B/oxoprolinase family protein, partial [Sphingomonadales bacterium]
GFEGASAVQVHMTNSRLTDPEVLEWRFPVIIKRFEVRLGSGGDGAFRGGDGTLREIEFLEHMEISLLSSHRKDGPPGLMGGKSGAPGRNRIKRQNGTMEELSGTAEAAVAEGDAVIIETPGGGGYGPSRKSETKA